MGNKTGATRLGFALVHKVNVWAERRVERELTDTVRHVFNDANRAIRYISALLLGRARPARESGAGGGYMKTWKTSPASVSRVPCGVRSRRWAPSSVANSLAIGKWIQALRILGWEKFGSVASNRGVAMPNRRASARVSRQISSGS